MEVVVAQDPTMGQLPRATGDKVGNTSVKMFTMTETRGDRIQRRSLTLVVLSGYGCLERLPLAVSSSAVVAFITSHLSRVSRRVMSHRLVVSSFCIMQG